MALDFSRVCSSQKRLVQLNLDSPLGEFDYIVLKLRLCLQNSEKRLPYFFYFAPADQAVTLDFLGTSHNPSDIFSEPYRVFSSQQKRHLLKSISRDRNRR